jgi:hypothetical protein
VIGVICNGAAHGELYSKYSYYKNYYYPGDKDPASDEEEDLLAAAAKIKQNSPPG